MKTPAEPPTTEDLETTLRVLQSIAGTLDRFPYLPQAAKAAKAVMEVMTEVDGVLDFRQAVNNVKETNIILSWTNSDVQRLTLGELKNEFLATRKKE